MKEYQLNYYSKFKCIADKCKNTCCAGWKISIDKESLSNYKNYSLPFSAKLKSGINFKRSIFKTDKNKRCAFLNDKGLCDLITNMGENSLCQVCRDHPRFRSFFDDRIETGLGFCCEEATSIILSFKDKIQPKLVSEDNKNTPLPLNQKFILDFRKKILDIIQDRSLSINERVNTLLNECHANFTEKDFNKIVKKFLSLEGIDNNWKQRLKAVKKSSFSIDTDEELSLIAEQFLSNEIYRHVYVAEDTMYARVITLAILFNWFIIKSLIKADYSVYEAVRDFSAEVEYSEKNLDKLFRFTSKFIEI